MMSRIGLYLLAVGLLAVDAAAQERTVQNELRDALVAQETKLIDAINEKDKAAIGELLADEAMSITSRGKHTTKQIIDALEEISFSDYKISDAKAFSVSEDVAILTYTFTWTGESAGQSSRTTTAYATSIWKQTGGGWRSVFYQETPAGE
ncbi:MAG: nuclear transport factor 2 family protein [Pirellulales bacterium]